MTNEEKIKEIINKCLLGVIGDDIRDIVKSTSHLSAFMMARWKDEQFKIILWSYWEKLKNEHRRDAAIAVSDIIAELFCDE